ncbi:MAG TPA: OsmC family protein, partial [Phycisphaerae bacterium]|nr:OsmC family protein [Phycisphaerae bacterium]
MTTAIHTPHAELVNGVDLTRLKKVIGDVTQDKANARTSWGVTTRWEGGTVTETEVAGCSISGRRIKRNFRFRSDEPLELGGSNEYPNPQELLMGALNSCMAVGYVALASLMGITVDSVEIETEGDIDLRGFLEMEPGVKPGYDELRYTVRIKGSGTEAQFREIHEKVMRTSPNRFNIANPVKLKSHLV